MRKHLVWLLLCSLVALGVNAQEYGYIYGTVTDTAGTPLRGVAVLVKGTKLGAYTNAQGKYFIKQVPVGQYTLAAQLIGYTLKRDSVNVTIGDSLLVNFILRCQVANIEGISVGSKIEPKLTEEIFDAYEPPAPPPPMCESAVRMDGIPIADPVNGGFGMSLSPPPPPPAPQFPSTEEYDYIEENRFLNTQQSPLSTFAADVDAAAYGNVRRFIMQDQLPPTDAIRTEEMVNYFDYDYEPPQNEHPLAIHLEYGECPWNTDHQLVHIGLQGKELERDEQVPSNLVFLLDVSGSMNQPKKLPLLKKSFKLLVDNLKDQDRVAIVVYAGSAGLVLPSTPGSEKQTIINALERLRAGGSTAGGQGIQLAYKVAQENFLLHGNNRVILATDGDFNVGISSTSELTRFITEKKDNGIFLTVLGFGSGNYKDDRLQTLADKGNGNHAYIDNILEAKKVFVNELGATLYTIAKDVKIQVEFNPAKVKEYRLIGYENRRLANEDFTDDKKDAGEIGAGHTVTALYEIVPATKDLPESDLKYSETKVKDEYKKSAEILTVKIRYKEPDGTTSKEFAQVLKGKPKRVAKTSDNFRFSAAVAGFSQLLRNSEHQQTWKMPAITQMAKEAKGKDEYGYRAEFISLCERATILLNQ